MALGTRRSKPRIDVENNTTISGSRISDGWGGKRAVYFVMQFSKPFASFGLEQDQQAPAGRDAQRTGTGAI